MSKFSWVTLATNDSYSLGALVLAYSLKRVLTVHQLTVLITPGVTQSMRTKLKDVFNIVQEVNVLDSQDASNLSLLARPELGVTFTKLHCWRLIQFEKCVFLDADTMVLQNCDELFDREELSAAPDVGWPDCFNSGVFVFQPSIDTFNKITEYALTKGSFDGGDQGLLNSYFSDWPHKDISKHLPFIYNTCSTATYSYLPAFKQYGDRIKILHFIGQTKPWLMNFNSENRTVHSPNEYGHLAGFLQLWWNIFCDSVHPNLNQQMKNQSGEYSCSMIQYMDNTNRLYFKNVDKISQIKEKYCLRDPWDFYYEKGIVLNQSGNDINLALDHSSHFLETNDKKNNNTNANNNCNNNNNGNININQNNEKEYSCIISSSSDSSNSPLVNNSVINLLNSKKHKAVEDILNSPHLTPLKEEESGLAGALSKVKLGEPRSVEQDMYEEQMRRQCWESGNIDYSGKDSFANIWDKISKTLESTPQSSDQEDKSGGI